MKRLLLVLMLALSLMSLSVAPAMAKDFPARNVKIIVPFAPGGAVDFTCRLIADVAKDYFDGKKVIVQNMPGGGAVIGQTYVAKARPDGYTMLGYTSSVVNNPLTKKTAYTYKSFQPVAMYCFDPEVVVVPAKSEYQTLNDLLEAAKAHKLTVATAGFSTSHHIAALVLEQKSGAKFSFIHNQSAAMQIQQLMGGHVDLGFMSAGEAMGYMKDGSLRVLGIMQKERNAKFPDVPTFNESDVDIQWGTFRGLAVPAKTPAEAVTYLETAMEKVVNDPKFTEAMGKAGYPVVFRGASDFEEYVEGVAKVMQEILPTLKGRK
ncbi:tripartite tricarboxylate transporter substrate binding protein [Pseudodesulfovibrio tunisiensis]|uniref:tripartite tricarboxylate transporter substrate binding protein n=1 Tax=Pseudodesulfovibrio tunisiensis TaxID=463192 RepID=UPI001FB26A0C|nr:tripartite tricarboxylate transporter substrate binding protein [Pseudodesulfovibrio tunisiensis]